MRRHSVWTVVLLLAGLLIWASVPAAGGAQIATLDIAQEQGVTYGEVDGWPLWLDVYRPPAREEPRPAVVLFPGWGGGRISLNPHALQLAEAGYVAFVVDYRLDWPEFIDDAQLAVRWVRANAEAYGVDPERICSYGFSSGGQLAAMLAVRDTRNETDPALGEYSSRVLCAVDPGGPVDATIPDPSAYENAWVVEHLGGTLEEVPDAYRDVSPVAYVDEQAGPFLILHGTRDRTVPLEHSRRLLAALQAAGAEVVYAEFAGGDHFDVAD